MRGTIESLQENSSRNNQKYLTVEMGGERYSVWDEKYFDMLQEGLTIDYEFQQNGNFRNLTDVKLVENQQASQFRPSYKDRQIARMSCLKSASEILSPVQLDPDKKREITIDTARFFERYVFEDDFGTAPYQGSGKNHGGNGR